ncbi:PaaI family thioesterase [Streptomyces sp. NPDC002668]|uniref:PaaI family thioesterase n=1 Tax=Streptomyces sp. NPDC002668 TaxID=3154422 RepID=UPI00332FC87D
MTAVDLATLSGLELLRWAQGEGPADIPGISQLLGMSFHEVEEGRVVVFLNVRPDFSNPLGAVHGGVIAALLDTAMACAVHTTLPARVGYTTLELKVNFIRAVAPTSGKLTAEGTLIHAGRRVATAEGKILNEEGKLIAHATTTCMIFRP